MTTTAGFALVAVVMVVGLFSIGQRYALSSVSQVESEAADNRRLVQTLLRKLPQQSVAGVRAMELCQVVPSSLHFTSLTSSAVGQYTIRGVIPTDRLADLQDFLTSLQLLTRQANLTYWRQANTDQALYQFAFSGQFATFVERQLKPLGRDEATSLFEQVANWGDQNGLDSLLVKDPVELPLTANLVHQRRKLWATGSYREISNFTASLQEVGGEAAVDELVIVPVAHTSEGLAQAQVWAVVDVLVQPSGL